MRSVGSLSVCISLTASPLVHAELVDGSVLSIEEGSFFTVGMTNTDPPASDTEGVFLTGFNGLIVGSMQEATDSHSGIVDGSESPNIDQAWSIFGHTGMHETKSPTSVLSASGNNATLDFSGWSVDWNNNEVNEGTGAWLPGTSNGIANVSCAVDCGIGDTYVLIYSASSCGGEPNCFYPTPYYLELHGTITSVVPIPPAALLFASGLALLAGRRRMK